MVDLMGFCAWQRQLSSSYRLTLGPYKHPIQSIPWALSPVVKGSRIWS